MRVLRHVSRLVAVLALTAFGGVTDLIDEEALQSGSDVSADARATLTIDGEVFEWEANESTTCTIGGAMPDWAHFQAGETTQAGDWVQFIDRGDGGINFSAVLDGDEYSGTGSGEADEITGNGFTYTGTMNTGGQNVDVELEVTC